VRVFLLGLAILLLYSLNLDGPRFPKTFASGNGCLTGSQFFNENWNSGAETEFGASTLCNQWTIENGSTSNISVTSAPTSGWNETNVLKLTHGTNAATIYSLGTFPYVVSTSNVTCTAEVYFSSTTYSSFFNFFSLSYIGAATQAYYIETSNSAGNFYSRGSTSFSMTAGTRHVLTVTLNGSSSFLKVDGTTKDTFTAPAADYATISLAGDSGSSAADWYWGQLQCTPNSGGPSVSKWPPSSLFDAAGGSNGTAPNSTNVLNGIHGGNMGAQYGTPYYTAGSSTDTLTYSGTYPCPTFASAVTVGGAGYTGNVGLAIDHHVPSGVSPEAYVEFSINSSYPNVYVGFCYGVYGGTSTWMDTAGFFDDWVLNDCDSTSTTACAGTTGLSYHLTCVESLKSSSQQGCVQTSRNTLYWVTGTALGGSGSSVNDSISFYNLNSNGTVGSLIGTVTSVDNPFSETIGFGCGALGSEPPSTSEDAICGNIIFEWADGSFPVLPPSNPAKNAVPMIVSVDPSSQPRLLPSDRALYADRKVIPAAAKGF
jgi:hypothetical protein